MWRRALLGEVVVADLKGAQLDAVIKYKRIKLPPGTTKVADKKGLISSVCGQELADAPGPAAAQLLAPVPQPDPEVLQPGPARQAESDSDDGSDAGGGGLFGGDE